MKYAPGLLMASILFASFSHGQVSVREEPRHHTVFNNGLIRILDVRIPPGDTTLYHKHETYSIIVRLSTTSTGSQEWGKAPEKPSISYLGDTYQNPFIPPIVHRVFNSDTTLFHVMDIEVYTQPTAKETVLLKNPELSLLENSSRVASYRLQLPAQGITKLDPGTDGLLMVVYKGKLRIKMPDGSKDILEPGSFHWAKSGQPFQLENVGSEPLGACVYQIKLAPAQPK
jgi:hypothetical protein